VQTYAFFAMASSSQTPNNASVAPIPDDEHTVDLPLTMSASVNLMSLPRDAHAALADVRDSEMKKGNEQAPRGLP
jgi:hypothetical protein